MVRVAVDCERLLGRDHPDTVTARRTLAMAEAQTEEKLQGTDGMRMGDRRACAALAVHIPRRLVAGDEFAVGRAEADRRRPGAVRGHA
jgi:hypothetical protein